MLEHKCFKTDCHNMTTNKKFCSKSCSNACNNGKVNRRKITPRYCKTCGKEIITKSYTKRLYCDEYCRSRSGFDWSKITFGDIKTRKYKQPSNNYRSIRDHSAHVYKKSGKPQACFNCGYDKHYHVSHIKPIILFSDDTPISVINSLDNLIALCPNCHWELDNGLIMLPLRGIEPAITPL